MAELVGLSGKRQCQTRCQTSEKSRLTHVKPKTDKTQYYQGKRRQTKCQTKRKSRLTKSKKCQTCQTRCQTVSDIEKACDYNALAIVSDVSDKIIIEYIYLIIRHVYIYLIRLIAGAHTRARRFCLTEIFNTR